jgi:hypothetical protein
MPARPANLKIGHRYEFVCLQLDIAGHSKLNDAERILYAAKERFHDQIHGIVATYRGRPFKWEGDGGAFLFPVTDGHEFDESVFAAFRILESLPGVNEELRLIIGLGQLLSVRISLDSGQAVFDEKPGLITGDFLNAFLKNERNIGLVDAVTITERVYRQTCAALRERFREFSISEELGCRIYRSRGTVSKAASSLFAVREPLAQPRTSDQVLPSERDIALPNRGQPCMDRMTLVEILERLTPADFDSVVTRIPGAGSHISRHGTVREHVAELLLWAESSAGPGLQSIEDALRNFDRARRG